MEKDYQKTRIGFVTDSSNNAEYRMPRPLRDIFQSVSQGTSSFLKFQPTIGPIKGFFALTALSTAAVALNPDLAGAAAGDFERGRAAVKEGTVSAVESSPATKLGAFVGNYEKRFEEGHEQGLKATLQKRGLPKPSPQQ